MTSVIPLLGKDNIAYLLDLAMRRVQVDLAADVRAERFPGLRGSHLRILSMIPQDGIRPSDLAAIAGMTRPALGELVAHLREHGYVSSQPDPEDGRAVVVTHTKKGRAAAGEVARGLENLNRRWAREVGRKRLDAALEVLAALTIDRNEGRA